MSISCVNKNSKQFKELAARVNVTPSSLESCVFEFQNSLAALRQLEISGEVPFPSDEYVRNYFYGGNTTYGKDTIRVWVNNFGKYYGRIFKNLVAKAKELIPEKAIHYYKDYKGNPVIRVGRPVLRNSYELLYFLEQLNLISGTIGNLVLNNVTESKFYSILDNLNIPRIYAQVSSDGHVSLRRDFHEGVFVENEDPSIPIIPTLSNELIKLGALKNAASTYGTEEQLFQAIKNAGVNNFVADIVIDAILKNPELKALTPLNIFNLATRAVEDNIAEEYNKRVKQPIDTELEKLLIDYLEPYHVEAVESSLVDEYGVTGIFDMLNKIIYLAKAEDRNSITVSEEFAHAFVRLMGVGKKKDNPDFSFLYNNVASTSIYNQVFELYKDTYVNEYGNPDVGKIKEEAIGLALAVAINQLWEKLNSETLEDQTFWEKLKEWFMNVLNHFKKYEPTDFLEHLNKIASEIVQKDYSRLNKLDSTGFNLLDYNETIETQNKKDGGVALGFMKYFSKLGNIITGSLSYRFQGTVYRSKQDSLHDIDMIVPASVHGIDFESNTMRNLFAKNQVDSSVILPFAEELSYFKAVKLQYPKLKFVAGYHQKGEKGFTVNAIYSENEELSERFINLKGSFSSRLEKFTAEERDLIYLFDFFFRDYIPSYVEDKERGLKLALYKESFASKLQMGRAKDVYDYQMWQTFEQYKNNVFATDTRYWLFQKPITWNAEQEHAIDLGVKYLKGELDKDILLIGGKAGTGKTTVVNEILTRYIKETEPLGELFETERLRSSKEILMTAVSAVATEVIRQKTDNVDTISKTIAAALGFKPVKMPDGTESWKQVKKLRDTPAYNADIIIIDEVSMLADNQYDTFMNILLTFKELGRPKKIIMIGDEGLLAPIQQRENKPGSSKEYLSGLGKAFLSENENVERVKLLLRVRQGELSPILNVADKFWDFATGIISMFPTMPKQKSVQDKNGAILLYQDKEKQYHKNLLESLKSAFLTMLSTKNPKHIKIVAGHNEMITRYNEAVYKMLHPEIRDTRIPLNVGDPIMFYDAIDVPDYILPQNPENGTSTIYNAYEVAISEILGNGIVNTENVMELLKQAFPKAWEKHPERLLLLLSNPVEYLEVKIKSPYGSHLLQIKVPYQSDNNLKNYAALVRWVDSMLFTVDRALETAKQRLDDSRISLLSAVSTALQRLTLDIGNVKLGFAITTHKSQGSTYDIVAVDYTDMVGGNRKIIAGKGWKGEELSRMVYTALTRARNVSIVMAPVLEKGNEAKIQDIESLNNQIESKDTSEKSPVKYVLDLNDNNTGSLDTEKKSWEEVQEDWDNIYTELKDTVELIEDNDEHYYKYYPEGKSVNPENNQKLDSSVTALTSPVENRNMWLDISSALGTTADTVGRDFFQSIIDKNYPNLTKELLKQLLNSFNEFLKWLNNTFKNKRFKIMTSPLSIEGKVEIDGEFLTIGGTVDMLIFDEDGNYYIWDFKTSRGNINNDPSKLNHYTSLVNFYRVLLELKYPQLQGKCKGLGLFQLNTFYATPNGLTYQKKVGTTVYSIDNNKQISANGKPILENREYVSPKLFNDKVEDSVIRIPELEPTMYYNTPFGEKSNKVKVLALNEKLTQPLQDETEAEMQAIKDKAQADGTFMKAPNLINIIGSLQAPQSDKSVTISSEGYKKGDPLKNTDTAYIFTENALANAAALKLDDSWVEEGYPKGDDVKTGVSDVNGTNQAGIRASSSNTYGSVNISPNAFGIIVKKYQLNNSGKFIAEQGQFKDTDSDFELFKSLNNLMFERLAQSGLKKMIFPSQMALGKAALPRRFAEWLQGELNNRFGINSVIQENQNTEYKGFGLNILNVNSILPLQLPITGENISSKGSEFAKKLTNVGNNILVEYKGKIFRNSEHAYQTWKSGEFDEVAYNSTEAKPRGSKRVNKRTNYQTMVEILTAKLQLHPELVEGINQRGGRAYLEASTHIVFGNKNDYWESSGQNKFIEALIDAYDNVTVTKLPLQLTQRQYDALEDEKLNKKLAALQDKVNEDPKSPEELYTQAELLLITERENLLTSNLFKPTELKHLAKLSMFMISDIISDLLNSKDNNKQYFTELLLSAYLNFIDTDFTTMSRIEIINTVGLYNLFLIVRNKYFNASLNANRTSMKISTMKKLRVINQNFNAFREMAYSTLANLENVAVDNENTKVVNSENEEVLDADTIETAAEIKGSAVESWQIGFRLLSAFNSLSILVKRFLNTIPIVDKNGNTQTNEFGITERVDAQLAVSNILLWTQHSLTLSDMVSKLLGHIDEAPWLNNLIEKLGENSNDETFKSQFFSNFRKYFLPYVIQYEETEYNPASGKRESTGRILNKIINENSLEDAMISDYLAKWLDRYNDTLSLYKSDGTLNSASVSLMSKAFKTISDYVQSSDFINEDNPKVPQEVKDAIKSAYEVFDVGLTDMALERITEKENLSKLNTALTYINGSLEKGKNDATYNVVESTESRLRTLFGFVSEPSLVALESVSYQAGKLHYSYVIPSFLNKLIEKLLGNVENYDEFLEKEYGYDWFRKVLNTPRGEKVIWRNEWLNILANDGEARELLKHFVVLSTKDISYRDKSPLLYEISLLLNYFYADVHKKQLVDDNTVTTIIPSRYALFKVPIMSNKPSEEYIRFVKYTDGLHGSDRWKNTLTRLFKLVVYLEIDRISTVRNRISEGENLIKNFETGPKNGLKFMFIDYLLDYLDNYNNWKESNKGNDNYEYLSTEDDLRLGKMLEDKISGVDLNLLGREADFEILLESAILKGMNSKFEEYFKSMQSRGLLETDDRDNFVHLQGLNMGEDSLTILESLENFFWNDTFASINILQLTITDTAYYKDAEDLQKRLAQIHAPGLRGNIEARWMVNGQQQIITDGITRTIYIKDFAKIVSDAIENIREIFKKRIEQLKQTSPEEAVMFERLAKAIIELFKDINVTDAQGYSSITSYRKKAIIFGKWSNEAEETYQKIVKGTYTAKDLSFMMLPLKPFVYSSTKAVTTDGAALSDYKVGVQNKNSEYLLLMMDAIILGELDVNNPKQSRLAAIYKVMEESHFDKNGNYKQDGIDTVQFNSTVKAGEFGTIDLSSATNTEETEALLREAIYNNGDRNLGYNVNVVHNLQFEDYCLLTELPAHFEGESIFGSQGRIISISDMPEVINGEIQYIKFRGLDISVHDFKEMYMKAIADNIDDAFGQIAEEFGLSSSSIKERNIKLSRLLLDEIRKDSRFSYDLLYAVATDKNGNFNIPLSDPIQSGRVLLLLNSIIKSRINKQLISGGPLVQTTNFGTTKELDIVFKDSEGNILQTLRLFYSGTDTANTYSFSEFMEFAKYENSKEESEREIYNTIYKPIVDKYQSDVASKQDSVAYYEIFAPASVFRNEFPMAVDENGNIDISKIPEEALLIIAYRIPTEAKYSMYPCKIVGFLPSEAGEVIMLPKDITLTSGSDFDADKMFTIRPATKTVLDYNAAFLDFKRYNRDNRELLDRKSLWKDIFKAYPSLNNLIESIKKQSFKVYQKSVPNATMEDFEAWAKANGKKKKTDWIANKEEIVNKYLDEHGKDLYIVREGKQITFKEFLHLNGSNYLTQEKVLEGDSKKSRDNVIFDSMWASLTSRQSADQMFVPGNFDEPKKYGYMAEVMRMYPDFSYKEIDKMSVDEMKDRISRRKNLIYNNINLDFFELNMVAGKLIGIFALNNISHSIVAMMDGVSQNGVDMSPVINIREEDAIIIEGDILGDNDVAYDRLYNENRQRISSVLASFLAASVDAVKDPVLNYMNVNDITAGVFTTLIRLGYPTELAMLFLTLPVIKELIRDYKIRNEDSSISINSFIDLRIQEIKDANEDLNLDDDDSLIPNISTQLLIDSFKKNDSPEVALNLLNAYKSLNGISYATSEVVSLTKYNSVTAAVGPLIANTIMQIKRIDDIQSRFPNYAYNDARIIAYYNPIVSAFRGSSFAASDLIFTNRMPLASLEFSDLVDKLQGQIKRKVTEDMILKLSDFYINFLLISGDNPVFKTDTNDSPMSRKRRAFVIKGLPKKIAILKKENPENRFLLRILVKAANNSHSNTWLSVNTRGMNGEVIDEVALQWQEFYNENPEIAMELIEYNFYIGGFGFSPRTFTNLVGVGLRKLIPNYIELLNNPLGIDSDLLLDQFIRNNHYDSTLVPIIRPNEIIKKVNGKNHRSLFYDKENPGTISVNIKEIPRLKIDDTSVVKYFKYRNKLYKFSRSIGDKVFYEEVNTLGGINGEILEINANPDEVETSIVEIKTKEEKNAKTTKNKDEDTHSSKQAPTKNLEDNIFDYKSNKPQQYLLILYMLAKLNKNLFKLVLKALRKDMFITDNTGKQWALRKHLANAALSLGKLLVYSTYSKEFNITYLPNIVEKSLKVLGEIDEATLRRMASNVDLTLDKLNICK